MRKEAGYIPEVRRANRNGVAAFFGVSVGTVDAWTIDGCPCAVKGSRGVSAVYDLLAVARYQFGLGKFKPAGGETLDPETLTPSERKAWYESEIKRRDLQTRDRELIPADEVGRVIATSFSAIAQTIRSLPDNLERRYALPPDVVEGIERTMDDALDGLADHLSVLAIVDNEPEAEDDV